MLRRNPGPHPLIIFLSGGIDGPFGSSSCNRSGATVSRVDHRNPRTISRRANVSGTAEQPLVVSRADAPYLKAVPPKPVTIFTFLA